MNIYIPYFHVVYIDTFASYIFVLVRTKKRKRRWVLFVGSHQSKMRHPYNKMMILEYVKYLHRHICVFRICVGSHKGANKALGIIHR